MEQINALQLYFYTLTGIAGLLIGSFLNVVALRLLSEESIVFPRSKCPKCQKQIAWYDNIPVISYVFLLRGKCRNCKAPISIQYPIVELITSALFVAIAVAFGFTLKTLFLLVLTCALIVITLTDLKEKVIFDITSIPLIPIGLVYTFFDIGNSGLGTVKIPLAGIGATLTLNEIFISAIIGSIVGAAFFEIFSRLGILIVGERAFGEGDTIIAAALGAWFGWKAILIIIAISFIFQLIVGIPVILNNMYKDKDYKSIIFTFILLLTLVIPYIGRALGISNSFAGAMIILLLSFGLALVSVIVILQKAKERQSFTFLPFGPALVFGGFVVMFWGEKLLSRFLGG